MRSDDDDDDDDSKSGCSVSYLISVCRGLKTFWALMSCPVACGGMVNTKNMPLRWVTMPNLVALGHIVGRSQKLGAMELCP